MANKIRDYTKLAADICAAVGKDNILSATHTDVWSDVFRYRKQRPDPDGY